MSWTRRKPMEAMVPQDSGHQLARTLSWPHLLALGVGFPDQAFEVVGQHAQKGVHLFAVVARQPAPEGVVADVERRDAQAVLRCFPRQAIDRTPRLL